MPVNPSDGTAACRRSWRRYGVVSLALISATAFRLPLLGVRYWADEIQTLAIAQKPLVDIPSSLRLDGAPPLFYVILHFWMRVFGDSETSTHALTLIFSLAAVVLSWLLAESLAGPVAGAIAAFAMALNPFMASFAAETRPYSLFTVLGLLVFFFAFRATRTGERSMWAGLSASVAGLLYTHTWSLFFVAALFPALVLVNGDWKVRRSLTLSFAAGGLAFMPWLPVFLDQIRHTGAPWISNPALRHALHEGYALFGGKTAGRLFLLALVVALVAARGRIGAHAWVVLTTAAFMIAAAWTTSHLLQPIWTIRYAIRAVPCLCTALACSSARTRVGVLGACLAVALAGQSSYRQVQRVDEWQKSQTVKVAEEVRRLNPDIVFAEENEMISLSRYAPGVRVVTPTGPVADPSIFDWRDDLDDLRAADPGLVVGHEVDRLRAGQTAVVVWRPEAFESPNEWQRLTQRRMSAMAEAASARLVLVSSADFGGVRVVALVRAE